MEETIDLFEHYETLPQPVQDIIMGFNWDGDLYKKCEDLLAQLKPHGYIFEYGLCGEPFNLTKI